jgi:Holliday junction resolvase-like predicted endonuclease
MACDDNALGCPACKRFRRRLPPARFDVVVVEAEGIEWLQAAFDGGGA